MQTLQLKNETTRKNIKSHCRLNYHLRPFDFSSHVLGPLHPDCEQYFNKNFEQPLVNFFRDKPDVQEQDIYYIERIPEELPLLILSIFWKASHCTNMRWKINLGRHQESIKKILKLPKIYHIDKYPIYAVIPIFPDRTVVKNLMNSTIIYSNVIGHHVYHLLLGGFHFFLKVSSHSWSEMETKRLTPNISANIGVHPLDICPASPVHKTEVI